jgi:hypothetical protein
VGVDGKETYAGGVDTSDDKICADVALVPEEVLFEHCHDSDDARGAAGGERVEFEVRGDERGGEFSIGGGAGAGAPDGGGDVVEFFAVLKIERWSVEKRARVGLDGEVSGDLIALDAYLVSYYGTACCSCVCCYL